MIDLILTTHNRPVWVSRMIDCVRRQTTQDYRLIIVNDGGCFDHGGDVNVFLAPNQGVHVARNVGLAAGDNPLVMFLDDDDWMSDSFVEEMVNAAKPGASYYYSRSYRVFPDGLWKYEDWSERRVEWLECEHEKGCALAPFAGAVFRRQVFDGAPFRWPNCCDWEWKIRNAESLWPQGVKTEGYYTIDTTGSDRLSAAPDRAKIKAKLKHELGKLLGVE